MHSPRSGGTTDAFNAGVPPHIIDIKGRWRCESSKFAYAKPSDSRIVKESRIGALY